MSCWKEKSLHWALNKFCGLDTSTDFAQEFWLMLCLWRVPRKVPSLSLHHPVPPKSLTHVKARHGKQNIIFIYIYFWINRSVFIFISNTLKSLQGLTKATRTELPSGIFINTDMQTQEGSCPGYHITAWSNYKVSVCFTCITTPDSHRMWLFLQACPWAHSVEICY